MIAPLATPHLTAIAFDNRGSPGIGDEGIGSLASSGALARIQRLSLRNNGITDAGAPALAQLAALSHLDLDGNGLTATGIRALAGSPHMANLRTLQLYRNRLGVDGAEAIARSHALSGLRRLGVYATGVRDKGVAALAGALTRLESLDAGKISIRDAGMTAISNLRGLADLDLYKSSIGDRGVRTLAESSDRTRLTTLRLMSNQIGDPGRAGPRGLALPRQHRADLVARQRDLGRRARGARGSLRRCLVDVSAWISRAKRRKL